jgi:hypothetical protein
MGPLMSKQRSGNIGLYYVCFRLAQLGWNVLPTSRNAKGIDLLAYSEDGVRRITVQVKALVDRSYVPLGSTTKNTTPADYWVICRGVFKEKPDCFVMTASEVANLAEVGHSKDGTLSYWLAPKAYEAPEFKENWSRIGSGTASSPDVTPTLDDLLAGVTDDNQHGETGWGVTVGREAW